MLNPGFHFCVHNEASSLMEMPGLAQKQEDSLSRVAKNGMPSWTQA